MRSTPPAEVLERALRDFRGELTVADAAAKSGLPLRDAEEGLRRLAADYTGHLAATSKGELIYSFPKGLVKPPETRLSRRVARAVARVAVGAVRLVVRAWVSVVLVGYALAFLALLIALALRGGDDNDSPMEALGVVLRVIAEALFWTFHPFSPVFIGSQPGWMHASAHRQRRLPFYQRVNRFVFGPPPAVIDPGARERDVLAEIRRNKGRIAPADVIRVTGLAREEAERLLLRLVVDYHGDIEVTDAGAIVYAFPELRATRAARVDAPLPAWHRQAELAPLTGNGAGSNLLFAFINAFNLVASGIVLANGLTLERLAAFFARVGSPDPLPLPPPDGIPLVLGAIPFAFSLALFALPLTRVLRRPSERRRIARENGWKAMTRLVLGGQGEAFRAEYTPRELQAAWTAASGRPPSDSDLENAVRELGGTTDLGGDGTLIYKFEIVSDEMAAVLEARARASEGEASPGEVVFSSADVGSGIREDQGRSAPETTSEFGGTDTATDSAGTPFAATPPAPKLLREGQKDTLEFLERLMEESKQRRRE